MLSAAVWWSLVGHLWYDHLFDHLSLWSFLWSFVDPKHSFCIKHGFVEETSSSLTPRNGQNRKNAARLWGSRPLGYVIPFWKRVVSWYGAQMLTHVDTLYLLLCGVVASARIKVPKDRGMTYSCSSYLVTEVTRPCVGRDLTVTLVLGTSRQRRSHVAVGSSLAWPFVGNPFFNYVPCTVLVVEPAI